MATRGRKPTPTAIKELEGNPGKRKLNAREPKPEKKAPSCPKWLEPDARKEWRRLGHQMEQLGILMDAAYRNRRDIREIVANMVSTYHPEEDAQSKGKDEIYKELVNEEDVRVAI